MINPPVTVEEYLDSSFEYDRELVDGVLVDRTGGEFDHSFAMAILGSHLFNQTQGQGLIPLISVRVRTRATRIRVPDLAVIRASSPRERIVTNPPLLAIEFRSRSDALRALEAKSAEYLAFGIEHVWVIDPYARVAYRGTAEGLELVRSGELSIPGSPIRIVLQELLSELDRV